MHTGKGDVAGPWIDTTLDNIQRLKRAIAEYEVDLGRPAKGRDPLTGVSSFMLDRQTAKK
jgi:hypothetical protein